jgi:outer membrane murein-binding lipoprotein Lpp
MMKLILIVAVLGLAGCSTFSKEQCEKMDWKSQGFASANKGDTFGEGMAYYGHKCGEEHAVQVDSQRFKQGYEEGLKVFCIPENGYDAGNRGITYKGTCSQNSEDKFLSKYLTGNAAFMKRRVTELEGQVRSLESEVSTLKSELSSKESELSTLRDQVRSYP